MKNTIWLVMVGILLGSISVRVANALPVAATKGYGGENTVGGVPIDEVSRGHQTALDGLDLYRLLVKQMPEPFRRFPLLKSLAQHYFIDQGAKSWYLDDRPLSKACINPTTVELEKSVAMCQDQVEVTIARDPWLAASDLTKAKELLHEVLTGIAISRGIYTESARAAYLAVTDSVTDEEAQRRFSMLGMGLIYDRVQVATALDQVKKFNAATCGLRSEAQVLNLALVTVADFAKVNADGDLRLLMTDSFLMIAKEFRLHGCRVRPGSAEDILSRAYTKRNLTQVDD